MKRKIIAVVSTKGGVGKTMIATNLAATAASKNVKVMLLNADSQRSAFYFTKRRESRANLKQINLVQWNPEFGDLDVFVKSLETNDELIIIDVRGSDGRGLRAAMMVADRIVIPTTPTVEDFDVLQNETLPVLNRLAMQQLQKPLDAVIVINQWHWLQRLHKAVYSTITRMLRSGLSICDQKLARRADYQEARAAGMGVTEFAPKGGAAKEFAALYAEIIGK